MEVLHFLGLPIERVPTKPWIAGSGLDPRAIRTALLGMDDEEARGKLGVTGFVEGSDSWYDGVRESIRVAEEFEGEPEPKTSAKP